MPEARELPLCLGPRSLGTQSPRLVRACRLAAKAAPCNEWRRNLIKWSSLVLYLRSYQVPRPWWVGPHTKMWYRYCVADSIGRRVRVLAHAWVDRLYWGAQGAVVLPVRAKARRAMALAEQCMGTVRAMARAAQCKDRRRGLPCWRLGAGRGCKLYGTGNVTKCYNATNVTKRCSQLAPTS